MAMTLAMTLGRTPEVTETRAAPLTRARLNLVVG